MSRTVVIFVFDSVLALDVTGPAEVFAMANRMSMAEEAEYVLRIVSIKGGPIQTASGVTLMTDKADSVRAIDTLIVSGGLHARTVAAETTTSLWIRRAAKRARRVCSVCTGAFILAETGLLNGRRAATHWASGSEFRERYPQVKLDLRPIYIRDGTIWTSAGVTAGIDLALALTEEDLGKAVVMTIAKHLVLFLHRPGGQAQFSSTLSAQSRVASRQTAQRFRELHAWLAENLTADLSVPALAAHVNMAPRSFARVYTETMDVTPAKAVENVRLEAAKGNLESGSLSLKEVAALCGFGNEERLRRSFTRRYEIAPSRYRERFGLSEAGRDASGGESIRVPVPSARTPRPTSSPLRRGSDRSGPSADAGT